jgi:hypothetical protein
MVGVEDVLTMKNKEIISNLVWLQGRLRCIVNENKSMVPELQSSIDLIGRMLTPSPEMEKPKTREQIISGACEVLKNQGIYKVDLTLKSPEYEDTKVKIKDMEEGVKALKFTVEVLCKELDKHRKTIELPFDVGCEINSLLFVLSTGGKLESVENRERARRGYNVLNPLLHRLQSNIDKMTFDGVSKEIPEVVEISDIVIPGGMGYATGYFVSDEMDILANGVGPVRILIIKQQETKNG